MWDGSVFFFAVVGGVAGDICMYYRVKKPKNNKKKTIKKWIQSRTVGRIIDCDTERLDTIDEQK